MRLKRLLKLAKLLTVAFLGLALAFWLWPSISNRPVWLAAFWASLAASSLAALTTLPHLFLGYLMEPSPRLTVFGRLFLIDFGSESSSTRRFIFWIPLGLLFLGAAWGVGLLPYAVVLAAYLLAPEIQYLLERLAPPLVLYLGSSDPHDPHRSSAMLAVTLHARLRRLVTILRPTESSIAPAYVKITSYRTHDDTWVLMLEELLELAQIVVIDLRTPTDALSFELDKVYGRRLLYKTLVLVDAGQVGEFESILGVITDNGGVCLTDYDILANLLYAFCNPRMRVPTADFPIRFLVEDIRRLNPQIDFSVWDDSEF